MCVEHAGREVVQENETQHDDSIEMKGFFICENPVELCAAISSAQGEMTDPVCDQIVHVRSSKGNYDYAYAGLASITKIARPALAKHGLALIQIPIMVQDEYDKPAVELTTILAHKSGQFLYFKTKMPMQASGPHAFGSAITYLRRYTCSPLFGLSADKDDDGNAGMGNDSTISEKKRGNSKAVPQKEIPKFLLNGNLNPKYQAQNGLASPTHIAEIKELVSLKKLEPKEFISMVSKKFGAINTTSEIKLGWVEQIIEKLKSLPQQEGEPQEIPGGTEKKQESPPPVETPPGKPKDDPEGENGVSLVTKEQIEKLRSACKASQIGYREFQKWLKSYTAALHGDKGSSAIADLTQSEFPEVLDAVVKDPQAVIEGLPF